MSDARSIEWRELLARQLEEKSGDPLDRSALRDFVNRFVAQEKHAGSRPEQVIRALKELTTPAIRQHVPSEQWARISDDVFQWCLDAYYGASPAHQDFTTATATASSDGA